MKRETEHEMLTRRVVLTGGIGCALTLLIPQHGLRAGETWEATANTKRSADVGDANLYVFRGKSAARTVIAATWSAMHDEVSNVRIHASDECWAIKMPNASRSVFSNDHRCQLFAGDILNRSAGQDARLKAVVIEVSNEELSGNGPIPVWAERISPQGHRWRIGSPFMAKLAVENAPAAKLYHASSPKQDGEELTRLVAETITANASARGYAGNAQLYGRRVASIIMPDALRFDPNLPVGFTFAAQNGRHPDDAAQSVVDTVINGTLTLQVSEAHFPLIGEFPYFVQPFTQA